MKNSALAGILSLLAPMSYGSHGTNSYLQSTNQYLRGYLGSRNLRISESGTTKRVFKENHSMNEFSMKSSDVRLRKPGVHEVDIHLKQSEITDDDNLNSRTTLIEAPLSIVKNQWIDELLIIDANIEHKNNLLKGLKSNVAVVEILPDEEGAQRITEILEQHQHLKAIHIVAHGNPGQLSLGSHSIDSDTLLQHPEIFSALNAATVDGADVAIYGCNFASGNSGEEFIDLIRANSHVDIAASDDLTGDPKLGGDWELEVVAGNIESDTPFSASAMKDFTAVLAITDGTGGTINMSGFPGGYASKHSYSPTGAAEINIANFSSGSSAGGLRCNTSSYNGQCLPDYAGTNSVDEVRIYFTGGGTFEADSIEMHPIFLSSEFTITPYNGATAGTAVTTSLTDNATLQSIALGADFVGITSIRITHASGGNGDMRDAAIDNLFIKNAPATNSAPTDITVSEEDGLDDFSVADSVTGTNSRIATLSTTDSNGGDSHTYSLVSDGASANGDCGASTSDDDNGSFNFNSNELRTNSALAAGSYNVCVQTNDGTTTFQEGFTFTITDTTAPTFNSAGSTPNDNATSVATANDIVVDFSENIAAGTGNITLRDVTGGTDAETFNVASATSTTTPGAGALGISGDKLYINPTSALTEQNVYAIQIATTAIDDTTGNSFAGISDETTFNFTTADETNPTFNSAGSTPNDDATAVGTTADIIVDFSENITAGTGNITLRNVTGSSNTEVFDITGATATTTPGAGALGISGDKLYINPTNALSEQNDYSIRIDTTAIDDSSANSFAGISDDTTFNFTSADETNPTFNSAGSTPTDNATSVATANDIVVDFSENIAAGTGNVTVRDVTGSSNFQVFDITGATATSSPGAGALGILNDKLYINPTSALSDSNDYSIRIDASAIDDSAGNSFAGISDDTSFNFATADETNPTFNSAGSTPNDNATGISITADIVVDFDENIAAGTGNITIRDVTGSSNVEALDITGATATSSPGAGALGIQNDKLYINPTNSLSEGNDYAIRIDTTAIDDSSGNSFAGITDDTTFNFQTNATSMSTSAGAFSTVTPANISPAVIFDGDNESLTIANASHIDSSSVANGQGGTDTLIVAAGISADLTTSGFTLSNFENLTLNDGASATMVESVHDSFAGNTIAGGAGTETITLGTSDGDDAVNGDADIDHYNLNDVYTFTLGAVSQSVTGNAGANQTVVVGALDMASNPIEGGSGGTDELQMSDGSSINNATVSGFETLTLSGGAGVTMTETQHDAFTTIAGSGTDQITLSSANGDSAVSADADVETYVLGAALSISLNAAGQSVTGSSGADTVSTSQTATGTLNGAGATDTLSLGDGASISGATVSNFENLTIANDGSVTMTPGQFSQFSGTITAISSAPGETINVSGDNDFTTLASGDIESYSIGDDSTNTRTVTLGTGHVSGSIAVTSGSDAVTFNIGTQTFSGTLTGSGSDDTVQMGNGSSIVSATLSSVANASVDSGASVTMTEAQHDAFTAISGTGTNQITISTATDGLTGDSDIETYVLGAANTITIGLAAQNVTGSSGDDTVSVSTLTATGTINASGGSDTLSMSTGANIAGATTSNFENLTLNSGASVTMTGTQLTDFTGTITAAGSEQITISSDGNFSTLNSAAIETYVASDDSTNARTITLAANDTATTITATAATDAINFSVPGITFTGTLTGDGSTDDTVTLADSADVSGGTLTAIELLSIANDGSVTMSVSQYSAITSLTAAGTSPGETVNLSGDGNITVTSTAVETYDINDDSTNSRTITLGASSSNTFTANSTTDAITLDLSTFDFSGSFTANSAVANTLISDGTNDIASATLSGFTNFTLDGATNDLTLTVAQLNALNGTVTATGTDTLTFTATGSVTGGNLAAIEEFATGSAGSITITIPASDVSGKTLTATTSASDSFTVTGSTSSQTINGSAGGDSLSAGDGADTINGNAGGDTLNGGNGADTLVPGAGTDSMTGGNGNDIFSGSTSDLNGDTISDLAAGDTVKITGVTGLTTSNVRFNGSNTLQIDTDATDFSAVEVALTLSNSAGGNLNILAVADNASDTDITFETTNNVPVFANLDGTPAYTEDGSAQVLDSNATVSDTELDALNSSSGNYSGATLTISRNGGANSDDLFSESGSLSALTASGSLTFGGNVYGTVTTNSGGTLLLTFSDAATIPTTAIVASIMQAITYSNSSDAPDSSVVLDWVMNDGTANSTGTNQTTVSVTAVNDAPVLSTAASPTLTAIDEDSGDDDGSAADGDDDGTSNSNNPGTDVATMVTDASITDPDGSAVEAIAVVTVDNTNGLWQYTTDNGTSWNNFTASTGSVDLSSAARLLDGTLSGASTHKVRFVPSANYNGTATITYRAWDKTSGSAGATADTSTNGTTTAFSSASDSASITVNSINDSPTVATNTGVTVERGSSITIANTALSTSDTEDAASNITYTVTAVPTVGALQLSSSNLSVNDTFTQDDIDNSRVAYIHAGAVNTSDSFTFTVADSNSAQVTGQTFNITVQDTTAPTITSVSIPNQTHKVGDTVTATITVNSDSDSYSLGSSTVAGYTLSSLSKSSNTTYTASFTITEGGTDYDASSNVPVSVVLTDTSSNSNTAFTTAIGLASDAIYANSPEVTLSADNNTIAEDTGVATLTAAITSTLNNQWPDDVTVTLAYSGTATNTTDYTRSGTSVTISAGSSSNTATVTSVADTIYDATSNETVVVDVSAVSVGSESGTQQETITITDAESAPTITLSVDNSTIAENGGTATPTVTLSTATFEAVTVNLGYSGTATAAASGADYNNTASTSITIAQGSTTANATTIITSVDDNDSESSETIIIDVTGASGGGATEATEQQQTVTITDDDNSAPSVSSLPSSLTITEDTTDNVDLSATVFADGEDDSLTITLAVDSGTVSSPLGTSGSVTVNNSGTTSMTLSGSVANLNTFLDNSNAVAITGAENSTANITLTVTPNDGALDGTAAASTVSVTAVNDDPTFAIAGGTFDMTGGSGFSTTTYTETENGVTMTAVNDSGVWTSTDLSDSFSTSGDTITVTPQTTDLTTVSFDTAVDIESLVFLNNYTLSGTFTLSVTTGSGSDVTITKSSFTDGSSNVVTPSDWTGVEEFTITHSVGNFAPVMDTIVFSKTGSDITLSEDVTGNIDLSSYSVEDIDSSSVTLTLTASTGTFSTPADGSGTGSGVTETLVSGTQVTLLGSPTDVSTYLDTSSAIQYTGASNANGNDAATVTISVNDGDGSGDITEQTINLDITAVNDAPTISGTPDTTVDEDTAYSFTPTSSDVENDTVTFSIANQPAWASFDTTSGELSGTPTNNNVGTDSNIVITASDGTDTTDLSAFSIQVINVNDAPTITSSNLSLAVNEDSSGGTLNITASDVDDSELTWSVSNQGSKGVASIDGSGSSATLTYVPNANETGNDSVSVRVSDGEETVPANISISISSVNDAPTIDGTPGTLVEVGTEYSFTPSVEDIDGDDLSFSIENQPGWASFNQNNGTLSGTPVSNDVGTSTGIVITVSDGELTASLSSFSIEVTDPNVNLAPSVENIISQTSEDTSVDVELLGTDPNDNALSYAIETEPSSGSVTIVDNIATYTPNSDFNGEDSFTYIASDGLLSSDAATVTLTVAAVNDAPLIEGEPVTQTAIDVEYSFIPTATDVDGDDLTFSATNLPDWAALNETNGELSGTPTSDDIGEFADIVITVSDGELSDSLASFTISVIDPSANNAPVATDIDTETAEDTAISLTLTATDEDGDDLTYSVSTEAQFGSFVLEGNLLTYTPQADIFDVTEVLEFTATDGVDTSNTATLSIVVTPVNDAPVIEGEPETSVRVGQSFNFVPTATDVEGDTLTFTSTNLPRWASFDGNTGEISGIPDSSDVGTYGNVTITVSDGVDSVDLAPFNIEVVANEVPVISGTSVSAVEIGDDYEFTPGASDADGDTLTFSVENPPAWASFDTTTGTLAGTPTTDDIGVYSGIIISVSDGVDSASLAGFDIEVCEVCGNVAPTINGEPADTVIEGDFYNFEPVAADSNNDELTFEIENQPSWADFDNTTGALTGAPGTLDVGINTDIVISVSDGELTASLPAFSITVVELNDAPTISGEPDTTVFRDVEYLFTPTASDPEGDTLTFSAENAPDWSAFNPRTGTLRGTPTSDEVGVYDNIIISVSDGTSSASLDAFSIEVLASNSVPVISGTPRTGITQGEAYSFVPESSDVDGDTLTFNASGLPDWLSLDAATGELSGTPQDTDVGTTGAITLSVSDGQASASLDVFTIQVTSTNSAPSVADDNVSVAEDNQVTIVASASDADGDTLTLALVSSTSNGDLSETSGGWVYTPNDNFAGTDSFVYQASDGELTSNQATITIAVEGVNDLPLALNDSFDVNQNESGIYTLSVLDNDSDVDIVTSGDSLTIQGADANFGTVNIVNNQLEFDPGASFIGSVTLVYAIRDTAGASDQAEVQLTVNGVAGIGAPVVSVPADIAVDATGLFTVVDLGVASATDADGNPLPVSLVSGTTTFSPGAHTVFWQAEDSFGTITTESQNVNVNPLISLSKDQVVSEGSQVSVEVILNGDAPSYPLTVNYSVSGSASGAGIDHDAESGSITFTEGRELLVSFEVFVDGEVESDETIEFALDSGQNVGANNTSVISITEANIAPEITLTVRQGGDERLTVAQDEGSVTISGAVSDANPQDTLLVEWSSDGLTNQSGSESSFIFTPSDVSTGIYQVTLFASDDGAPILSNTADVFIEVVETLEVLSSTLDSDGDLIPDDQEGYADSDGDGIPDYLDSIDDCNVVPEQAATQNEFLVESEPGVCMRQGIISAVNSSDGIEVITDATNGTGGRQGRNSEGELVNLVAESLPEDTEASNIGGIFDFILYDLPEEGQIGAIVLPQRQPIPANAVYRKYKTNQERWVDFIIDDNNQVFSSVGERGVCPPPGSDEWVPGLTEGHWCVQLQIQDGGTNDDDGEVNGAIVDPGGVAVVLDNNSLPVASDDVATMQWNTSIEINVLENDSDVDGDTLTVSNVNGDFGEASIDVDSTIIYTPDSGFVGEDILVYAITDGNGGTASAQVTVTIEGNRAPGAVADSATTDDETAIEIDVLANDIDVDGDALNIVSASAETGEVTITADNTLIYTPEAGFDGLDTITYVVADTFGETATGTVSVVVEGNQAPQALDDSATTAFNTPVTVNVLGNDMDVNGDTLTVTAATVSSGSVSINDDSSLTFTPVSGFSGNVEIQYTISDGLVEDSAVLTVTVLPQPVETVTVTNKSSGGGGSLAWMIWFLLISIAWRQMATIKALKSLSK